MIPKEYPQNFHTAKNIHFAETPQKYWKNSEPKKMVRIYTKISEYPPPPPPTPGMSHRGNVALMKQISSAIFVECQLIAIF